MHTSAAFMWDPRLLEYDFGLGHPMSPARLAFTHRLICELGLLERLRVVEPRAATWEELTRIHSAAYVAAVQAARPDAAFNLGSEDNPVFAQMHAAAALVAGATVGAVEEVLSGRSQHAVNLAGGLHHALPAAASGFCVYNDVAVGIAAALAAGVERVAYVDVDAHHGDGVERAFWDDPRVLTVSIHESGHSLFPGTGFAAERGGPGALGTAVNLPVPAGTADEEWLRGLHAVVPPVLEAFRPQLLISQHGADAHRRDPLAHLHLSVDGQRQAAVWIRQWARDFAQDQWVAVGGGGYDIAATVPRVWAALTAEVAGIDLPSQTPLPEAYREAIWPLVEDDCPRYLGEGRTFAVPTGTPDPESVDELDRQIWATRAAVFPELGLDPWRD